MDVLRKHSGSSANIKSVNEILKANKAYNHKHGTNFTYGQYVSMVEVIGAKKKNYKKKGDKK